MTKKITTVNNEQGFQIIVMPALAQHTLFEKFNCDLCEDKTSVEDNVYYESVLDKFFCERCHNLYIKTAIRYKIDAKKENINFEKVKKELEKAGWYGVNILE
ncbi:MAG: hypothetical protein UHM08_09290 [Bacteroidales bacterium]|nr:hypothetical protein [Bacteroidales bacterium]